MARDGARTRLLPSCPACARLARSAMGVRVEHEPGRFVVRLDGAEATLVYERRGDLLDLQHTFTPPALRGREIAARLTEAAFAYARAQGLRIVPTCSYTRSYLARHPELLSPTRDSVSGRERTASVPPGSQGRRRAAAGKSRRGRLSGA